MNNGWLKELKKGLLFGLGFFVAYLWVFKKYLKEAQICSLASKIIFYN